jgi:glycopeptide antibiotics resistance protein
LSPNPGRGQSLNLRPGVDLSYGQAVLNFFVNVLLFVPYGAFASAAHVGLASRWRVLLFAAALSCSVEVIQWYSRVGRQADINDIIANAVGALIGIMLAAVVKRATRPSASPSGPAQRVSADTARP